MRPKRWMIGLGLLGAVLLLTGCPSRGPYHDPPPRRDMPKRDYALPQQAVPVLPAALSR
ncbi:MAG: hypothetical protein HY342_00585 [Candidatus Lambdaproteobacteria bacterium]|nr:hypothetical protein [Candidatus Lambdaproteobacteria bacterium]